MAASYMLMVPDIWYCKHARQALKGSIEWRCDEESQQNGTFDVVLKGQFLVLLHLDPIVYRNLKRT